MIEPSQTVPEIGDLVQVRSRRWIVTNVKPIFFARTPARQHRVDLLSIEEDSRSESAGVIWEVEPGAKIKESDLPEVVNFDDYSVLETFLDAVRWGAATNVNSDLIQSPYRSGITIEDYQLDPVLRAVKMANVNLMIADDVGLGKTIEAGLVIQELLLRHRARTVLVVCPSSLQIKWQEEMRSKFGLEFRIVDTEYLRQLRRRRGVRANPWTSYPRLITSMDWAKSGIGLEFLEDILPKRPDYPRLFDILIVDEAHNVAPSTSGQDSLRTQLIRTIAPHFAHHLFVTATPHNGNPRSWQGLLELLDKQRFHLGVDPDMDQLNRVLVRRLKSELRDQEGKLVFPERRICEISVTYTDEEREIHALLDRYRDEVLQKAKSSSSSSNSELNGIQFVLLVLKKRLFSSPRAFAQTLNCHICTLHRLGCREKSARDKENRRYGSLQRLIEAAENAEDKPFTIHSQKDTDPDLFDDPENEAIECVTETIFQSSEVITDLLGRLQNWANSNFSLPDSKLQAILDWLKDNLFEEGKWSNRRVILFTEYTATLSLLHELLTNEGMGGEDRLMVIDGSTPEERREEIKAAFQADPSISNVRILLATDAASEGIDLQNWCADLIHVEIPWNPNVLEQRNGRIDRHGQKQQVVNIWIPVGSGKGAENQQHGLDGDADYLSRICRKVELIREDLGSVSDLISENVKLRMLGAKVKEISQTAEQRRIAETNKRLRVEKDIAERAKRCHEKLKKTQQVLRLTPQAIRRCVELALKLAGRPGLKPVDSQIDEELYMLPELSGSWAAAYAGIADPFTHSVRPVTFDHEVAKRMGQNVVLLHLNHPLVAQSLRFLRETVWSPDASRHLNRCAVCVVPNDVLETFAVIVFSRLIVTGSDGSRLHEEVTIAGGLLKSTGFVRENTLGRLSDWIEKAKGLPAPEISGQLKDVLRLRFEANKKSIREASNARALNRRESLLGQLTRRCEEEKQAIEEVLISLRKAIQKTLTGSTLDNDEIGFQRDLFAGSEINSYGIEYDRADLERRIEQIPVEIEEEKKNIDERFRISERDARNLPMSLLFLVPEKNMV